MYELDVQTMEAQHAERMSIVEQNVEQTTEDKLQFCDGHVRVPILGKKGNRS